MDRKHAMESQQKTGEMKETANIAEKWWKTT